jgi:hypothetical protein
MSLKAEVHSRVDSQHGNSFEVAYQPVSHSSIFPPLTYPSTEPKTLHGESTSSTVNMSDKAPGAGHESPPTQVSWLTRDVLLFANSIGATADELHFIYVRNHPPQSPGYLHAV